MRITRAFVARYITLHAFETPGPVIVYNYPKDIKAFYMRANDDGKTVAAMDVLVRPTDPHLMRRSAHIQHRPQPRATAALCSVAAATVPRGIRAGGACDAQVPGVGELIGGSQREERLDVLEAKLDSLGMDKVCRLIRPSCAR